MKIAYIFFALSLVANPVHCFEIPGVAWLKTQFKMLQLKENCSAETPLGIPIFTAPSKIHEMYQLMKDVHEIFTHCGVTYWIDSGTLLGSVRHQGIIPWDDDIDLCVDKSSEEKIYSLDPVFNFLGYRVTKVWGVVLRIEKIKNKEIFADLLLTEQRGNRVYYAPIFILTGVYHMLFGNNGIYGYRDGEEIFINKDELFPLKEYKFGECTVMGPKEPSKYLESMYGKDVFEVAYQWHAHSNDFMHKVTSVKIHLTEKDKVPAQPTGPLRERVADLINKPLSECVQED